MVSPRAGATALPRLRDGTRLSRASLRAPRPLTCASGDRRRTGSSTRTRKGRNLAANPDCVLSVSLTGIDLVVEGGAVRITDRQTLLRLAKRYASQGWPASVSGGAFTAEYSAPSAGPPPWNLYAVRPTTAFGVATAEPSGATRWQFETRGGDQT